MGSSLERICHPQAGWAMETLWGLELFLVLQAYSPSTMVCVSLGNWFLPCVSLLLLVKWYHSFLKMTDNVLVGR